MASEKKDIIEIRCRSCQGFIGYADANRRVYCSIWCMEDPTWIYSREDRDSAITYMYDVVGLPPSECGEPFGLTRQAVNDILVKRGSIAQTKRAKD
ncbi:MULTISPECIES: hypothetical protein [Nonomuraea]|uniref:hypothetical protein n=1 Tax=Nonomuraea TaxID=83681 RepID=UPI0012FA9CDE|nr:hypothetical protein [Nonomuraea typhae]